MTTFALVHGAWHGSWCWDLLVPELRQIGHETVTMDLPIGDPAASFDDYADLVVAATEGHNDVVVVGHSWAGQVIPMVAARRQVSRLVYLCATVPEVGRSFAEQLQSDPDMLSAEYEDGLSDPDSQTRREWVNSEVAHKVLYSDCDDSVAEEAFRRLIPQALAPGFLPFSLDALPRVPSTYVMCTDDNMVTPAWSRRVVRDRLAAIEPVVGNEPAADDHQGPEDQGGRGGHPCRPRRGLVGVPGVLRWSA